MVCCIVLLCMMLGLFFYVSLQQSVHCNPNSPFYLFLLIIKILNLDHLHLLHHFFQDSLSFSSSVFKLFCKFFFQDFFFWIVLRGFFLLKALNLFLVSIIFSKDFFLLIFSYCFFGIFVCLLI